MADSGLNSKKKLPQRKCIGCNEVRDKKNLIRVIKTPEGNFELDMTGKKNGRGAYLCNDPQCIKKAMKCKGLDRSFKMSVPKEVYEALEKEYAIGEA